MSDAVGNGWRAVSKSEADTVVGRSCPAGIPDPHDCPCPESEPGMPTYSLHPTQASVLLSDTPLTYSPPRGPGISLQLRYNHREENQPQIFSFANIGVRWSLNWLAYVEEVPFTMFGHGTSLQFSQPKHLAVHVPEGASSVDNCRWQVHAARKNSVGVSGASGGPLAAPAPPRCQREDHGNGCDAGICGTDPERGIVASKGTGGVTADTVHGRMRAAG
jgi:hypothetical protein